MAGKRYLPYLIAVLATVAIVAVPSTSSRRQAAPRVAAGAAAEAPNPSQDQPAPAPGDSTTTTAVAPAAQAPSGKAAPAPASGQRPAAVATSAPPKAGATAAAATTAANASQFPGVGTPAALNHPLCDKARGKFKLPSLWAPPCVVAWPAGADNGGATAQGVTADSIRIVWRLSASGNASDDEKGKAQVLSTLKIFTTSAELWGRKLDVRFFKATGEDEIAQRADAIQAATMKPFLALASYNATGGAPRFWSAELASRGIVVFDTDAFFADLQAQAGLRWAYATDDGLHAQMVAEWVGKRLVGHPAKWAGDATMGTKNRVFGLIYPDRWQKAMFDKAAAPYGLTLASTLTYQQAVDVANAQERARTQIAKLKNDGVTSIIGVTDWFYTLALTREATNQLYRPEWIITGWGLQDLKLFSQTYDQQQWAHAFGIGMINLLAPPAKWEQNTLYRWFYGRDAEDTAFNGNTFLYARDFVPALQLAGPHLTPATFKEGMFSKPPAGGPWGGSTTTGTSYGKKWLKTAWDDYSGYDGMNEMWWDPNQISPDEALYANSPGAYWHVNRGKQYTVNNFPTGDPQMFDKNGALYQVEDQAPEDNPPTYPPPAK